MQPKTLTQYMKEMEKCENADALEALAKNNAQIYVRDLGENTPDIKILRCLYKNRIKKLKSIDSPA